MGALEPGRLLSRLSRIGSGALLTWQAEVQGRRVSAAGEARLGRQLPPDWPLSRRILEDRCRRARLQMQGELAGEVPGPPPRICRVPGQCLRAIVAPRADAAARRAVSCASGRNRFTGPLMEMAAIEVRPSGAKTGAATQSRPRADSSCS